MKKKLQEAKMPVQEEKNNTTIKKIDKPKYVSEDYIDFRTGKVHPFSENSLRGLVEKLIDECSDNHKVTAVEDFYFPLRIDPKTWYRWVEKYEWFKEANEMAIRILGRKRYNKVANWEYDRVPISHTQHRYEPEWLESNKYHADLKKEVDESLKPKMVIEIQQVPSSEFVPVKE